MGVALDISGLRTIAAKRDRYAGQLNRLRKTGKQTTCVEAAVASACDTLQSGTNSFVIYGEPQSGKTEMMICLTAKLLDDGHRVIVHLLNDSVQLLQQNLDRFQRANLSPAAKNFSDVIDPDYSLATGFHVIFCKKNASDLTKLNQKLERIREKVIVDDEADFATPNALINKGDVTRINALIEQLISLDGIYIGVTATPARLDLNNTFDNDNEKWVNFPPHAAYMRIAVSEAARVLSSGGRAIYVVGENTVSGTFIPNAKIVSAVAELSGLKTDSRRARELPSNRRYLPPPMRHSPDAMNGRMRREVILSFSK
jgi:hypothetical protein